MQHDIKFEDLRVCATLGKGSFGFVQLVKHKDTSAFALALLILAAAHLVPDWLPADVTYALKGVSKAQIVETRQQGHIMSEKRAMCAFNHPFVVKLHATFKDKNRLYFLLDPVLGGELFTVLRRRKWVLLLTSQCNPSLDINASWSPVCRLFPEPTARFFAASVLLAFEHMHERDYVYRDLKPEVGLLLGPLLGRFLSLHC